MFQGIKNFSEISLNGLTKTTPGLSVTCPVTPRTMGSTELLNRCAPSESRSYQMNRPSNCASFGILKPVCKVKGKVIPITGLFGLEGG